MSFKFAPEGHLVCEKCGSKRVHSHSDFTICLDCGASELHNTKKAPPRGPATLDRELWLDWAKRTHLGEKK